MNQYYQIIDGYPAISPIMLDGFTEYTIGAEPQELKDALQVQVQQEAEVQAKTQKQLALDTITVTTTSGKVFDGRDKDQVRMMAAIQASGILGLTETQWKLHDNSVATITLDELKEALALSIQAVGNIVVGV